MTSNNLYDLERLTSFRHDLHKNPELAYQEVRTSTKIIEYLNSLGVSQDSIRRAAKTGIIVDIKGKAPASGKPFCIAFRADMDALPIKEENPNIDYKSINEAAHMCGHDMHMTCLIGGTSKILEKIDQIPCDKTLRLLFQPAEETIGGAFCMIQEGALIGVDEVYGFHNRPWGKPGKLFVKPGYVMARCTGVEVTIFGKGGHSSTPELLNDPLQPAVDIFREMRGLIKSFKEKDDKFVFCMPMIRTGKAFNAISDTCEFQGTLRSFNDDLAVDFLAALRKMIDLTSAKYGCTAEMNISSSYPAVNNHEKEAENVIRVAKKVFGEENVSPGALPVYGGEDFSYYIREKPGAFFFLSSCRNEGDILHTCNFNPHDDLIPLASSMWYKLVEDRFDIVFKD